MNKKKKEKIILNYQKIKIFIMIIEKIFSLENGKLLTNLDIKVDKYIL